MKRILSSILVSLLMATVIFQVSGCSLIGFGLGSAIDASSRPKGDVVSNMDLTALVPGTFICIVKKSGEQIWGKYLRSTQSEIIIQLKKVKTAIPLDEIHQIHLLGRRYIKWILAFAGFLIDLTIIGKLRDIDWTSGFGPI